MILNDCESASIEQSVKQAFVESGFFSNSGLLSALHFSSDKEILTKDWEQQWKPIQKNYDHDQLRKIWSWNLGGGDKATVGWYREQSLLALCRVKIVSAEEDGERYKNPSVAIFLLERHQAPEIGWFKGLTRPFFYETARQIGLLKKTPDMHVLGGYSATDQDDFDLFFEMRSDLPDRLPLKDCCFRTRKCEEQFDWASLPIYFQMKSERKAMMSPPTPAI